MWPAWILWSRAILQIRRTVESRKLFQLVRSQTEAAKAEEIQHLQQRLERAESEPKLKAWWIFVGCSMKQYYILYDVHIMCSYTYLYIRIPIDISYIKICTCTTVVWVSILHPPPRWLWVCVWWCWNSIDYLQLIMVLSLYYNVV